MYSDIDLAIHKDRKMVTEFCENMSRIYLYGAGYVAKIIIDYLAREQVDVSGIIVTGTEHIDNLDGIKVISVEDYVYKEGDGIIISVDENKQPEIIIELEKRGINSYYCQKVYIAGNDIFDKSEAYSGVGTTGRYFDSFKELDSIGMRYGTDKNSRYHNYLNKYEFFLRKWKDKEILLMELGVFKGESIRTWTDYFTKAQIVGVDIDEKAIQYRNKRVDIIIKDLSESVSLEELKGYRPTICIDDASHMWSHQIKAVCTLFPAIADGGIYIVEDIGTSFGRYYNSALNDACISGYEFCALIADIVAGALLENINVGRDIYDLAYGIANNVEMISFILGSCIIVKK